MDEENDCNIFLHNYGRINILGECDLEMNMNKYIATHTLFITNSNLPYQIILGYDWLNKFKCLIDFELKTVYVDFHKEDNTQIELNESESPVDKVHDSQNDMLTNIRQPQEDEVSLCNTKTKDANPFEPNCENSLNDCTTSNLTFSHKCFRSASILSPEYFPYLNSS